MPETLDFPEQSGSSLREENTAENAVSSYETRIESVGAIFDTTQQILNDFQETFFERKEERQKISTQLRDTLAHNEHLRKRDFDSMTQNALSSQEERETEVKNLLKGYLNQQREMARILRENLSEFKEALAKGDVQRIKEFQELIKEVMAKQNARKEEVTSRLKEFQKEQQEMAKRLKMLLAKGSQLRIKDLKEILQAFRIQHKERLNHQTERRKEVNKMLGAFKQERKGTAKNWQAGQIRDKTSGIINVDNLKKAEVEKT